MNLKKINCNDIIHCNTAAEAEILLDWADKCGFCWRFGTPIYEPWKENDVSYLFADNHSIFFSYGAYPSCVEFRSLILPA